MDRYTAYGLTIASDLPLPELEPAPATAVDVDVIVRQGRIDGLRTRSAPDSTLLWARRGDVCLRYPEAATFHIRSGTEIQIERPEGSDERTVRLLLLGPALAVLLHQRGLLVLHASAVAFGSRVAAFVGEKGEGKSTLAAALHGRGHPLVADDLAAIDLGDPGNVRVRSGFPQLKLAPDALEHLGEDAQRLPRLHPDYEKRARRVDSVAVGPALSLARIYVLGAGEAERIETLSPQQTFVELVRHSYVAELLGDTGETEAHFRQVVSLASRVPVCRLSRRRDLGLLPEIAALVENDFSRGA